MKRVIQELVQSLFHQPPDFVFVLDVRQGERKMIRAKSRQEIRIADCLPQPVRYLTQERVAGALTEGIVDVLESFQIDDEQAELLAAGQTAAQLLGHAVQKQVAVGESGEGVVIGEILEAFLGVQM